MSGFFAIYRQIDQNFLHPLQQKRKFTQYEAWLDLIGLAYFKDKEKLIQGKKVLIERGSFDTAATQLAERWKWDRETVERFLRLLQGEGMISRSKINPKNPKSATILKINKYNEFQNILNNDTATDATLDAAMGATPKNKVNKDNKETSNKNINSLEKFIAWNWKEDKTFTSWLDKKKESLDVTIRDNLTSSFIDSKKEDVILWAPNAKRKIKDYKATLQTFINKEIKNWTGKAKQTGYVS